MKTFIFIACFVLVPVFCSGQSISLSNKMNPDRQKELRADKPISLRLTSGQKIKGNLEIMEDAILLNGKAISMDEILSISGYVQRSKKEKAAGLGLTIASVVILPFPLIYIFEGFGLGSGNAIFIGATVLFFDFLLAYAGTNLMGVYPRNFSLLNWELTISAHKLTDNPPLLLPFPND